jgi:predicted membrane protein
MTKETLKELGKGVITFGNSVGALSVVYGLFGKHENTISPVIITAIVMYIIIGSYVSGIILLEKGADDD